MQLELLLKEGLLENNYVLEIGCGALVASIPVISFLQTGHYVGIDPNKWLIDASLQVEENQRVATEKQPLFLYNDSFDARTTNMRFDYILAHSIMSHAPLWQLQLFLQRCSEVLQDNGKVVFSLCLTEPNEFGNKGAKNESTTDQWQYPAFTFFHKETIVAEASKWFKEIEHKKLYTRFITSTDKRHFQDWFVLTK
jgi:cyclopropane fatty-acyl-phospholipid synthase-like methyltransferase